MLFKKKLLAVSNNKVPEIIDSSSCRIIETIISGSWFTHTIHTLTSKNKSILINLDISKLFKINDVNLKWLNDIKIFSGI